MLPLLVLPLVVVFLAVDLSLRDGCGVALFKPENLNMEAPPQPEQNGTGPGSDDKPAIKKQKQEESQPQKPMKDGKRKDKHQKSKKHHIVLAQVAADLIAMREDREVLALLV
jgi:hypothetical protein